MCPATVIKRLRRELQHWRESGEGPEVSWTKRGIEIAIKEVTALAKEQRFTAQQRRPRPYIERWLAADLFKAIRSAHNDLGQGKKQRAAQTLGKMIEWVREKQAV